MIVSHEYRFIFFKTIKTAGTSVEIALSRLCGPDDIITPIGATDEQLRRSVGGRGPQHCAVPARGYTARDWAQLLRRGRRPAAYNHMHAVDVRRMVGSAVWRDYLKFTVVRNPWDAVISQWYFKYRNRPTERPPLHEFLNSELARNLLHNHLIYSIDGAVVADVLCRYENLGADLEAVWKRLGLPLPVELPRAKGEIRSDRRPYRDVLTDAEAQEIAEKFAPELRLTDYTY